jgi:peroxiredoxin Q/BCP
MEGKGFRDRIQEFDRRNIVILAASMDQPEAARAFKKKFSFPFPILSDTSGKLSQEYGAAPFKNAVFANRVSYLIDETGNILHAFPRVNPSTHAEELLKLV